MIVTLTQICAYPMYLCMSYLQVLPIVNGESLGLEFRNVFKKTWSVHFGLRETVVVGGLFHLKI